MAHLIATLDRWDRRLCLRINSLSGRKGRDRFFYAVSRLGDGPLYASVLIMLALKAGPAGEALLKAALPAFILNLTLYKLIKGAVQRERPFSSSPEVISRIAPPDRFSFPSGHTAAAVVMTVICLPLFTGLGNLFLLFASLVGFSRIYNGVHYPGDILAGVFLGLLCGRFGLLFIYH